MHEELQCYQIDVIDELVEVFFKEKNLSSPMRISIEETRTYDDAIEVKELVLQLQVA